MLDSKIYVMLRHFAWFFVFVFMFSSTPYLQLLCELDLVSVGMAQSDIHDALADPSKNVVGPLFGQSYDVLSVTELIAVCQKRCFLYNGVPEIVEQVFRAYEPR